MVVIIYYFLSRNWEVGKGKTPPEASGAWPVFGHLSFSKKSDLIHISLGAMADRYGPIFTIRIGSYRGLVASSSELAKECFTLNNLALASRPNMLARKHIGYNYAMLGFAPNVILRMVVGKRYSAYAIDGGGDAKEARSIQKAITDLFNLIGLFVPADAIPYLRWLDLGGYEKAMKKTLKALDGIVGEWLEERKRKRAEMNEDQNKEQDFMDVLLSVLPNSDQLGGFDPDTIN